MLYRPMLGMALHAGQQFMDEEFFYTTYSVVFASVGLTHPHVTQVILSTVNVVCTLASLWIIANSGCRKALMADAAWSSMYFMLCSLLSHFVNPTADKASCYMLIVFSSLSIAASATTWSPLVCATVAELHAAKLRAQCLALALASN